MPKFAVNDLVRINIIGTAPREAVVQFVQGVTADGIIYEPTHPSVVSFQYIIEDLAYSEQYLELV